MLAQLVIYTLSFIGIWIGSGFAIRSIENISKSIRVSSFLVSFLILGLFTSVGEFSVGINSVLSNDPEIYVGNLIGASIVLFLLIIPLLAIFGNSIHINEELRGFNLLSSIVVVGLPVILAMDGQINRIDSFISIISYLVLVVIIQSKKPLVEKIKNIDTTKSVRLGKEISKILVGIVIIFIASKFVVEQTVFFSEVLGVSPFLLSVLLIAIGTNIPELSLVVRSLFIRNNQVAFGDYVGSAAFNTFLFGILTLIYGKPVILVNSYLVSLVFSIFGLVLFYHFARSKHTLSKVEGIILLLTYGLFLFTEITIHDGFAINLNLPFK